MDGMQPNLHVQLKKDKEFIMFDDMHNNYSDNPLIISNQVTNIQAPS